MPTSTDLVTDLPADFETFGQAVATSMADLLGGTTGQVLAKASNTDMDFSWVAQDDSNAIQNAIVDAKGDLIAATAADTPARLAVGTNGQVLTADSTAATGLAWATPSGGSTNVAGKNAVLNSAMNVWQRGTSFAITTPVYTADRWQAGRAGNATGSTVTRQVTNDTTNLPNIQYALRFQRDSGNTGTGALYLAQSFESVNSIPFAGKTVTVSYYARAGANYSPTSSILNVQLQSGTGTDQNILTAGYTGGVTVFTNLSTLTTTWQRFTATGTIGATATEIGLFIASTPTGTAGANDWFEITGVQVEIAGSASAYSPNTSTQALELAACQRYYYRMTAPQVYSLFGTAYITSASAATGSIALPVTMRTFPTSVDFSTVTVQSSASIIGGTASSITLSGANTQQVGIDLSGMSGLTANQPARILSNNSTSAYLGFSAEL